MADYRNQSVEKSAEKVLEIINNFNEKETKETIVKDSVEAKKSIKKKKKELRKKVVTRTLIAMGILIMTTGGGVAKKIVTGKEALRKEGVEALPRGEYSIFDGSNGYKVVNLKTNQEASYDEYIIAVKQNAAEKGIEPISVYLAVENVSNEIVAKDATGRDFSTLEIIDAALEYVDSLNQNQGRGSR